MKKTSEYLSGGPSTTKTTCPLIIQLLFTLGNSLCFALEIFWRREQNFQFPLKLSKLSLQFLIDNTLKKAIFENSLNAKVATIKKPAN